MTTPSIVPGKTRIGWIGTGVMGASMVGHLLKAGFSATVYNRSKDKAAGPLAAG
ncbi:MAG: NAD(P)-binding domain-containing protein, partial [Planctomycetota bacterium]